MMPYRRNEHHGSSWSAGSLRDRDDERGGGGRHPAHRPYAARRREEFDDELYELYDDPEFDRER